MLRHFKNLNELTLYAALSCGCSFVARLHPEFFFPLLLLRLSLIAYCWYIIAVIESNRAFGWLLGSAVILGLVGGNWDAIELTLEFDPQKLSVNVLLVMGAVFLASVVFVSRSSHE